MKFFSERRAISLFITVIFILSVLTGCQTNTVNESDSSEVSTDLINKSRKTKIDSLYVSELKDKELVNISSQRSYSTTGDKKINDDNLLTNDTYAEEGSDKFGWLLFQNDLEDQSRITTATALAKAHGMGIEMEVEGTAADILKILNCYPIT